MNKVTCESCKFVVVGEENYCTFNPNIWKVIEEVESEKECPVFECRFGVVLNDLMDKFFENN